MTKNEVSFYEEFSKKFSQYLENYLGIGYRIDYSCNQTLDNIIADLEVSLNVVIVEKGEYIPKLKVDIVFAVCDSENKIRLILIEAKYLNQLALQDYSQLIGYLQVAKK